MGIVFALKTRRATVSDERAATELSRLLTLADMPGEGWMPGRQRAWKNGVGNEPFARRARKANLLAAIRSFQNLERRHGVAVEVLPFASAADAIEALGALRGRFGAGDGGSTVGVVVSERERSVLPVPGQTAAWAFERQTQSSQIGSGVALSTGFVLGTAVVIIYVGGPPDTWKWRDVETMARRQAARLADAIPN